MLSNFFIQSLAIVAVSLFILSFHAKTRKNILILQICSLLIWTTHYILLSAWTGSVLMVFNVLATVLFLFKGKNKNLSNPIILYAIIGIFIILTLFSWNAWYSIFPLLGISTITVAKWQDKPNLIRIISFPTSVFWIVYDYFVGAYGSIIAESLILLSIIISLIMNKE